jgi:hypothetical protein
MFNVLKTKDDEYILKTKQNAVFCSTQGKLIKVMFELGVNSDEIEYGLSELIRNDHNVANYGINKTFIFSKNVDKEEKHEQIRKDS